MIKRNIFLEEGKWKDPFQPSYIYFIISFSAFITPNIKFSAYQRSIIFLYSGSCPTFLLTMHMFIPFLSHTTISPLSTGLCLFIYFERHREKKREGKREGWGLEPETQHRLHICWQKSDYLSHCTLPPGVCVSGKQELGAELRFKSRHYLLDTSILRGGLNTRSSVCSLFSI